MLVPRTQQYTYVAIHISLSYIMAQPSQDYTMPMHAPNKVTWREIVEPKRSWSARFAKKKVMWQEHGSAKKSKGEEVNLAEIEETGTMEDQKQS